VYYESGWKHVQTKDEWKQTVRNLVSKDNWIIDGQYGSTLDIRMPRADIIIFFNFNKFVCLYRACLRALDKTQPFDKAEGNFNRLSWDLIKKILIYDKNKMLKKIEEHSETKKIFVVKNSREANELLVKLTT
jgi:adenylate kinase family enzyme